MNDKQLEKYLKAQEEVEKINPRKYKTNTRKVYKRYALKFTKILIENNIDFTYIRNISTSHIKQYAKIELDKGRHISVVIQELRGVYYYYGLLNRNTASNRRQVLIDLRILQRYLEGDKK